MTDLMTRYFAAFNAHDVEGMIACLSDDIAHHVNEGEVRIGKAAFREFCTHMNTCYRETLRDIVLFENGDCGAAEYIVHGTYLQSDKGLPPANGQTYKLPAGSFFSFSAGRICRVVTYYNLADWIRQVENAT